MIETAKAKYWSPSSLGLPEANAARGRVQMTIRRIPADIWLHRGLQALPGHRIHLKPHIGAGVLLLGWTLLRIFHGVTRLSQSEILMSRFSPPLVHSHEVAHNTSLLRTNNNDNKLTTYHRYLPVHPCQTSFHIGPSRTEDRLASRIAS